MNIAYLGQMADVSGENGISKKIRSQTEHWLRRGHRVRYFSLVRTAEVWRGLQPLETDLMVRGFPLQRVWRSFQLSRRIREWQPDVVYFRYAYHSPGLPKLFRSIPTIAEVNSDDVAEYPVTLSRAKVIYHRATRRRVLRATAGFICVTRELAQRFAGFAKPTEVIANGVNLAEFAPREITGADPGIRLIFVGTPGSPWHGMERVAELARLFPAARVEVVGCTTDECTQHGNTVPVPPNLTFHGMLPRERYEPMVRSATAAIGTMALYRKGMEEACPLKVREYLALGVPVIAAYRDTDVPEGSDYFLRLPNDSNPIAPHREAIATWLDRWRGRRVERTKVGHLDDAVKEERRLAFLARFGGSPASP